MKNIIALKVVLLLIGAAIVMLGLNVGLGGIRTLGWQLSPDFLTITNADIFHTQDSHIRFMGGVWFGIGGLFLASVVAFEKLRTVLIALCAVIAVAGLFRLSSLNAELIFSAEILPSLVFEIVGFPLLCVWLFRSMPTKVEQSKIGS